MRSTNTEGQDKERGNHGEDKLREISHGQKILSIPDTECRVYLKNELVKCVDLPSMLKSEHFSVILAMGKVFETCKT